MLIIKITLEKQSFTIKIADTKTLYDLIVIANNICKKYEIVTPTHYIKRNRHYELHDVFISLGLLGIEDNDTIIIFQKKNDDSYYDLSLENIARFKQANHLSSETKEDLLTESGKKDANIDRIKTIIAERTSLDLQQNLISVMVIPGFNRAIATNAKLIALNLRANILADLGAQEIAAVLQVNQYLRILDVSLNNIGDSGVVALAKMLEINKSLTTLDLSMNNITDIGVKALAKALIKNHSLTALSLWSNKVSDVGAQALYEALNINTALTVLELSSNTVSPKWLEKIDVALQRNRYYHERFPEILKDCLLRFPSVLITLIRNYISDSESTVFFTDHKKKSVLCSMSKSLFLQFPKKHAVDVVLINAILKGYETVTNKDGSISIKLDAALSMTKKIRLTQEFINFFQAQKFYSEVKVALNHDSGFIVLKNIKLNRLMTIEELSCLSPR